MKATAVSTDMTTEPQVETYKIQDWVFRDALGKYDIDLGDSNAPCLSVKDISEDRNVILDYGNDRGGVGFRRQVAALYQRDIAEIGITHGSQEALYLIYRTLLSPGDHVLTFSPGWQQSWRVPSLIGCELSVLPYTKDFELDLSAIEAALGPKTRAVILNLPCNPTGKGLSDDLRRQLLGLLKERNIYLIADEEYLVDFNDSLIHSYEQAISVSSLSKIFGVPGLRLGWLCGHPEIVERAMEYKHLTTIANSVLCEHLGSRILDKREEHLIRYRQLVAQGYALVQNWASRHSRYIEIVPPDGTPFCWLRLHGAEHSLDFCRRVLDHGRVLTMPAELFGQHGGVRLTFAREASELQEGLNRIGQAFSEQNRKLDA